MKRKGKFDDSTLYSQYLQEDMQVKWYIPEGFTPFNDYCLCIMQDGNDYFQIGRVATLSDQLHEEMEIEPTIFMGIHYKNKQDRAHKYHPDGTQQQDYISFLVKEAIPAVEEALHITPIRRILLGDSLAGTLAFMVASQFPHTFDGVIMQSPFVNEAVLSRANETDDYSHLMIHHSIGTEEREVDTTMGETLDFLTDNRLLHERLQGSISNYHYHEFNGNHTWKYWQQDLKKIFKLILS
ncbi:alpha/beta hydrolase [Gracilibacillus alcaliphilus]|uniref:alpha/beta hydrolase n=1 Tax=Gracilibacillus alcaliphilus TaxID=1401441 RepID=UPI00195DB165|nr:alpha/beta hydrolase-fold protein [Gracilibacillus alcaliphilus]MBM7675492.1 enterochelin esterase-like enzyme [Gracilibacillus alcaliphilus]